MDTLPAANELALSHLPMPPTTTKILAPFILLASLAITIAWRHNKQSDQVPDALDGWPVVGNVVAYSNDPVSYLRKATAKYGKLFKTNMIFTSIVWLRDPDLNKLYLETKEVGGIIALPVDSTDQRANHSTHGPSETAWCQPTNLQGHFVRVV